MMPCMSMKPTTTDFIKRQEKEMLASSRLRDWLDQHSIILKDPWKDETCATLGVDDHAGRKGALRRPFTDPTCDREMEDEAVWTGKTNSEGLFNGSGILTLANGDSFNGYYEDGKREGWGVVQSKTSNIQTLTGIWSQGHLQGKGKLVTYDTEVIEGWFKDSRLHGPARKIVMKKFRTFRQQVSWLGVYQNGVPSGHCWEWWEGGGYLTGEVDGEGHFSGDNIAFIFPDLRTAIVGEFNQGVLVRGRAASMNHIALEHVIAIPSFQFLSDELVKYSKSTKTSVGPQPLIGDPYERRTVKVSSSGIPGSGEGLYAARDIKAGEVVAFYNGVRVPYVPGEKECWDTSGYKIFINADWKSGERIDLPGDLINLDKYCATLGHKMNHNFEPNCTEWFFKHPRHDLIPCVTARIDIPKNSELYLHYGYDPLNCPQWYKDILDKYMADNPHLDMWDIANPERLDKQKPAWYTDTYARTCSDKITE